VWPLRPLGRGGSGGETLLDAHYREWILRLQRSGVEIALHGVADGTSSRGRVEAGLDYFQEVLGADPSLHTNHFAQREGIYWGPQRLDGALRRLYGSYRAGKPQRYAGEVPGSAEFWGDICRERIRYVRNFVFRDINTLKRDVLMPYHDERRPYVRHWFSASDGSDPEMFCRLLSEANQDRLEAEGGACIVYTHFGLAFQKLPAEFRRLVTRLSRKPGWFVPATPLLDHIGAQRGWRIVGAERAELNRMQWRWALERTAHRCRRALTPDLAGAVPEYAARAKGAAGQGG
jgi:hypothetical protein